MELLVVAVYRYLKCLATSSALMGKMQHVFTKPWHPAPSRMSHKEKRHHLTIPPCQSKYNLELPGSLKRGEVTWRIGGQGNYKSKGAIGQKRFEQIGQLLDGQDGQERKGDEAGSGVAAQIGRRLVREGTG